MLLFYVNTLTTKPKTVLEKAKGISVLVLMVWLKLTYSTLNMTAMWRDSIYN